MKEREKFSDNSAADAWIIGQIVALAEVFGEGLTAERQAIYADSLSDIPSDQLRYAIRRAIRELKWFPKVAELRELAGFSSNNSRDGRPGVEEAWALCPKSEEASVVWTEEMADAFEIARKLLSEGDDIAARMAFKEKYGALLANARLEAKPVRWIVSLGWDKADRIRALSDAVRNERITAKHAYGLLGPESGDELLLSLPMPERKLLVGNAKRDLSQLSGFPRLLAELADAKALPAEVISNPQPTSRTPSDRSLEEVRRLREKVNAQIKFLKRSRNGSARSTD